MHDMRERLITALRWSERYFKTDMVYLAKGGFWLTLGRVGSSLSALALAIAFANLVSPETYGSYKYVLSIAGLFTLATLPGVDTAYVRAVARGKEEFWNPLFAQMRWGLLGSVGAAFCAAYYFWMDNQTLGMAFAVVALFTPILDPLALYEQLLTGRRAFAAATGVSVAARISATIVIIGTIFLAPNILAAVFAYFFGWTVVRILLLRYTIHTYPPNSDQDPGLVRYGAHLTTMKGAGTIAGSIGNILLFHMGGGSALAMFTLAIAPIEQLRGLLGSIEPLAFPKMARDTWQPGSFHTFIRRIFWFFILLACVVLAYILLAPFLFPFLFPQYQSSIIYSQLYAPTLILSAITAILAVILRAKGEMKKLYVANAISIAATLLSTPILTTLYGVWGVILSVYIIKSTESCAMLYLVFRQNASFSANSNRSNEPENGTSENKNSAA